MVGQDSARTAAFVAVFERHYDAVARYCARRLAPEDAGDAVARVFLVAWRKMEELANSDVELAWLYSVAHNEVRTMRRSLARAAALRRKVGGLALIPPESPDAAVVRSAEHERVIAALWTLSRRDREVIMLSCYEDLSLTEMGAVLHCTTDTARKRLDRALGRLRHAAKLRSTDARPRSVEGGAR